MCMFCIITFTSNHIFHILLKNNLKTLYTFINTNYNSHLNANSQC